MKSGIDESQCLCVYLKSYFLSFSLSSFARSSFVRFYYLLYIKCQLNVIVSSSFDGCLSLLDEDVLFYFLFLACFYLFSFLFYYFLIVRWLTAQLRAVDENIKSLNVKNTNFFFFSGRGVVFFQHTFFFFLHRQNVF